ncbi:MAG: glycosyltransferase family 39 protein [Methanobacterium paludis]|nr:glycosyltransferase family 39 protein [Methanobacterium paludis]
MNIGPMWDTYDFLSDALLLAGKGTGYADLTRPLVLPFLTSLFFRLGYISEATIFAIDGVFLVFGTVGLYLLFKLRFNDFMGFLGGLLFSTFPIVILFSGIGFSDIPSVSFSIWAFYFTILAVKRNSKFFYLSFPFAMIAFLTRYTAGLILFPMLFYILADRQVIKNLKNIFIGILMSCLAFVPVIAFFYTKFGNPLASFQSFFSGTENPVAAGNYYYQPDIFYYLHHLFSYIGIAGIVIVLFILIRLLVYGFFGLDKIKKGFKQTLRKFDVSKKTTRLNILVVLILALALIFFLTFAKIHYMASEVIFFALCITSYKLLERLEIRYMDMNFLFLAWFMAFFIFHSTYVIKDDRYFVTMAPATAYFLVLGFNEISSKAILKIKNRNLAPTLLSLFVIIILLASTISYIPGIMNHNVLTKEKVDVTVSASNWLESYDPNYRNKVIYADYWAYFSWYLKMNVRPMPVFKDGIPYTYQLNVYSVDKLSNVAYNNELNQNNADYYFSMRNGLNLTYYKPIKQFGFVTIYQRV